MAKYIIDLPDKLYAMNGELRIPIRFGESPVKDWRRTGLNVKPHTEPDRKAIEDAQEEAWKMASKCLWDITNSQSRDIFGTDCAYVPRELSYQEAKAKYEAWKKQKDEIHVGDEIVIDYDKTAVVLWLNEYGNVGGYVYSDGKAYINGRGTSFKKTGRHFDEVDELMKKMRGNNDD